MELWVVLWQFEGFTEVALAIKVSDEGTCEIAINAAGRENHPALIAGPAVPTLYFGRVQFCDGIDALRKGNLTTLCFSNAISTVGQLNIRDLFMLCCRVGVLDDTTYSGLGVRNGFCEIHHVEICVVVPDMEYSEAPLGEHQPPTIGRDTWQSDTAVA